jgi:anti-anti-sigma factor
MSDFSVNIVPASGDSDVVVMAIAGPMTVQYAGELRDHLLEVFAKAKNVTVDLSGVTDIDVAGLQLLCSAHRTADYAKTRFAMTGGQGAVIREAAEVAGLQRQTGCSEDVCNTCLWIGGRG